MKIGVDYYPEHWDKSMWEKDADLMKLTGVTIVRLAEFAWSKMEPKENEFDFAWLDEAIVIFAKRNIEVILGTPTNCPPLWMYEKYPDMIQTDEFGNRISLGIRGHRCYNSPSLLEHTNRIVDVMTKRYGSNKTVVGWQIDNELDANHCTCEYCTDKFRNWLKNKYTTLEAINEAYGSIVWSGEYSSWSQINPPLGHHQNWLNPAFLLDYNRYASESMVDYVKLQARIIRANCPSTLVTTNTWFCENMPDFYDTFKELDVVSYDNYPTTKLPYDKEEVHSHSFHLDLMRGIKRQNFWIMEQLSGAPGCWMPMLRTPRPGMIKGYTLQAIAHGADNVLHFRWRSAIKGAEMFWHGIIDHNNALGRRYYEYMDLCNTTNQYLTVLNHTKVKNQIAILYSSEQEYALKIQPQVEGMHYYGQLKLFHNAFSRLGVGTDIINWSENLDDYKIVVAPTIYVTNEEVTKNLYAFVKRGGTLILTNRSGVKDDKNACLMEYLPGPFRELSGVQVEEYDPIGSDKHIVTTILGKRYICEQWCDVLKPITAKAIATYADDYYVGAPAVTMNNYESGKVYYLGTVFGREYYYDLLSEVLRETLMEFYENLPDGVEISYRTDEVTVYLFVFNNTEKEQTVKLNKKYKSIVNNKVHTDSIILKPFEMEIMKV